MGKFKSFHIVIFIAGLFIFKIAIADTFRESHKEKVRINAGLIK